MTVIAAPALEKTIPTKSRLITLDILRGIALLGILLITMPKFALPEAFLERILQQPDSPNYKMAYFINILFEGKMRALFSMIFGAGILLFIGEKEKTGKRISGIFYSRMFWLAMFGLFHSHVLLSGGDILYPYALCGMFLFFFRDAKPAWLLAGVLSLTALDMAVDTYYYNRARTEILTYKEVRELEQKGIPLTDTQLKVKSVWGDHEKWYIHDQKSIDQNIELMRSSYWTIAASIRETLITKQTRRAPFVMMDPMALMFLGMFLFKWGFFSGQLQKKTYVWSLIVGYCIGIPLAIYSWKISARFPDALQFAEAHPYNIRIYIYPVQRILLTLGHVSLILLLIRLQVFKKLFDPIAAVGRMAFSNYIFQTILCTLIFLGYGLGYYAQFEYYELYYIIVAIWVVQLVISPLWLKYFRFGPFEWAWRSLTYWRLQPMLLSHRPGPNSELQSQGKVPSASLYQKTRA